MAEEKKIEDKKPVENKAEQAPKAEDKKAPATDARAKAPARNFGGKRPSRPRRPGGRRMEKPKDDFEQKMVDLARVTRVMAGGKRMKFRACMVIGDKKGKVGVGIAKGVDVAMAIQKAVAKARKNIINVPILDGTIPHEINIKEKSSRLMMKPGRKGSGIKAGGVMRIVFELAGVKDVVGKILGTNNKINNTKATLLALDSFIGQEGNKATEKKTVKENKKTDNKKSDKDTKK